MNRYDKHTPKICQECNWVPSYNEDQVYYDCYQEPRDCALKKARRVKREKDEARRLCKIR